MNFWVCNLVGWFGWAVTAPSYAGDGIVVGYPYIGVGYTDPPFDLGRTATHETGHWLNLYHIWREPDCGLDDLVPDTPKSDGANYYCSDIGTSSCSSLDMAQNYMDYTEDPCMNLFTEGQKDRMRALFAPGGLRESILSSPGCGNVNTLPAITTSKTTYAPGEAIVVNFSNSLGNAKDWVGLLNEGASPASYIDWLYVDDTQNGTIAGITDGTVTFTSGLSTPGNYTVHLFANNSYTIIASYNFTISAALSENDESGARTTILDLNVFPNPANDYLNVAYRTTGLAEVHIQVIDVAGKIVFKEFLNETAKAQITQLDISQLNSGFYFIQLVSENSTMYKKFTKY